jgi:hypothetical protein
LATKKPAKNNGKEKDKKAAPSGGTPKIPADVLALRIKGALLKEGLEDPAFRKLALSNTASAIKKSRYIGGAEKLLPAGFKFRVVEETAKLLYLIIPQEIQEGMLDPKNPKDTLLRKAVADPQYLKNLTSNPKPVLESEFLVDVPGGLEVKVLKETATESIVVFPADLRPEQKATLPASLAEYQAKGWCGKTVKTIIENLCPSPCAQTLSDPPRETEFQSPFCTTEEEACQIQPL